MKLFLKIRYDGTAYAGYQVQPNVPTVQNELNKAASDLFGVQCDVTGCSRTDSGVHATCFCATVEEHQAGCLVTSIPISRIPQALNVRLPDDISVFFADFVSNDFHPRYCVVSKTYEYKILNSHYKDPFSVNRAYHFPHLIDDDALLKMQSAADRIVGTHDFSSFMASGSKISDAVRTVYSCSVVREDDFVKVRISADGFLYNMVRIICGTLIEVAKGNISVNDIDDIISSRDRKRAGSTLPPQGLYLVEVKY
jgi:tRNA pseudouridine38-40 synthase